MIGGCGRCDKVGAALFLLFGIIFLLQDLGKWAFWDINWWTVVFLLMGITGVAMKCCKDCCGVKDKKK
tara:strand:+ start:2731 stop:2934 length:204 start_codon:yes stop_codon:yes gene_type:complete